LYERPSQRFAWTRRIPGLSGSCGLDRQGEGFDRGEIEFFRRAVDVEANYSAFCVEVDIQAVRDLARLHARAGSEFDIETIGQDSSAVSWFSLK
jgi:hypothetical protein